MTLFLSSLDRATCVTLGIALVLVRVMTGHFSVLFVLLPLYTLLLGLFAIGIGWLASSLQVYLRDTAQVVVVAADRLVLDYADLHRGDALSRSNARFLVRWNPLAFLVTGLPPEIAQRRAAGVERNGAGGRHLDRCVRGRRACFSAT